MPIRGLLHDLRYAGRGLRRSPLFTVVVVGTLALGIGASTAMFSAADAVLLRPLPVRDPGGLATLSPGERAAAGVWGEPTRLLDVYSYPLYERLRAEGAAFFQELAAQQSVATRTVVRRESGQPIGELAAARAVSANLFGALGVSAVRGRGFLPDEDRTGATATVVLSHGYWQHALGGDPAIVGARLQLNARPFTVVGHFAAGFQRGDHRGPDRSLGAVGRP